MSITLEVFYTPGCAKCAQAKEALRAVVRDFDEQGVAWREVDILEEMDRAVDLGIAGVSAIAIDGELAFPSLPKPEALRRELRRRLASHDRPG